MSDGRDTAALYVCPRCNYAFPGDAHHDCTRTVWRRLWPLWMATAILLLIVAAAAGFLWSVFRDLGNADSFPSLVIAVVAILSGGLGLMLFVVLAWMEPWK